MTSPGKGSGGHRPVLRTMIVDDEPLAREGIRLRLMDEPDIFITGEYDSGGKALSAITADKPDLLFLDIQMPVMNGFELLRELDPAALPRIIFVTAYEHHAIEAFRVNALDYLLKPVDTARFHEALTRAREALRQSTLSAYAENIRNLILRVAEDGLPGGGQVQEDCISRIPVRSGGRVVFIQTEDVDWIEAAGDYVCLHVGKMKYLLHESMVAFGKRLDRRTFQRIHKSTIVNLDRISELRQANHGDFTVLLRDGTHLRLSRSYRSGLEGAVGSGW